MVRLHHPTPETQIPTPTCHPIDTRRSQSMVRHFIVEAKFYDLDLYLRFARWEYCAKANCLHFPRYAFDPKYYNCYECLYLVSK